MNKPKYKPIPLAADDHGKVDSIRNELVKRRGASVSLAQTVMEAIRLLENKLEAEE